MAASGWRLLDIAADGGLTKACRTRRSLPRTSNGRIFYRPAAGVWCAIEKSASFEFGVGGFGGSRAGVSPAQRTLEARSPSKMIYG